MICTHSLGSENDFRKNVNVNFQNAFTIDGNSNLVNIIEHSYMAMN